MCELRTLIASASIASLLTLSGCDADPIRIPLTPSLEDRLEDGSFFTPSTISFVRSHHWLERVEAIHLKEGNDELWNMELIDTDPDHDVTLPSVPLHQLVPRLHYPISSPPDSFDAFNLMMAEYSRNGLALARGGPEDDTLHFESSFEESPPWTLDGDYEFVPNPHVQPVRLSMVNNCLEPGLWELVATDRTGEIYHGWFRFPLKPYHEICAAANDVDVTFVASALEWTTEPIPLDLSRLRHEEKTILEDGPIRIEDGPIGYSSQGSRRKIAKGFVKVERDGLLVDPQTRRDLLEYPVYLSEFVPPGKYARKSMKRFDLGFLGRATSITIKEVEPLTRYSNESEGNPIDFEDRPHMEWTLRLGNRRLIFGNLPLPLLVQQEDFVVHGFGVGILSANEFAERRQFLLRSGHHPVYAYLVEDTEHRPSALNSHDWGMEQVIFRARPRAAQPHWEVTITSYERIVDLVKYIIPIPPPLLEATRSCSDAYVTPIYFSYRDDNTR